MRHSMLSVLASGALLSAGSAAHAQAPAPAPPAAAPGASTPEAPPTRPGALSPPVEAPAPAPPAAGPAAPSAPPGATAAVTPPRLLAPVEPVYPAARRESGEAASVGLVLTLDAQGHVTDAVVSASGGADFDAAALEAARRLSFAPALHGDAPIPSKIPFRFEFRLAPEAPPPPPLAAAAPPSPSAPPSAPEDSLDIEVEGERPPREPTRRAIAAEEITKIPGTNGDALRGVLNLPGIAQPGAFQGLLIVRGSSPRDSQIFVDGMNVPIVYHFGGLSSVLPSELLERIDFYPGNFGSQFGRASGGIVDVAVRSPRKEGFGGLLQLDLIDGRILVEGAITDDTRVLLGGRRSWLDAWLGSALESAGSDVRTAPVYYDYQAMIEHDVSSDTSLRLFAYGSDDRLALLLESPDSTDPANGGDISGHTSFWRVQGRVDTRLSSRTRWTTSLAFGQDADAFRSGTTAFDTNFHVLDLRSDLRTQLLPELALVTGLDVQTGTYDVTTRVPAIDFEDDTAGPLFGRPVNELSAEGELFRPGAYAMAEISPIRGLKLMPGVRVDYIHDAEDWSVDPRLGFRYDFHPSELRTTLKGGIGVFHKPPEGYESVEPYGTPGIESERAIHYGLGVEQELSGPLEVSLEGFYKDLGGLAIATPDAIGSESGVRYVNAGHGRSYGAELLLRYKPEGRFFGWLAYTLSRSERRDAPGEDYSRFDFDQTHVLTALGSLKLGRGWQLGTRFRYITGAPYTPFLGGVLDYDAGVYAPLESVRENSARRPARHQLDLRVDKQWTFQSWALSAYLDVQNVYNGENVEDVAYNYDYSERKTVRGLPILPIIGLRGEL